MDKEQSYAVTWEIDVYASSPSEAARKALAIQRDKHSTATCFSVFDADGNLSSVDLIEDGVV